MTRTARLEPRVVVQSVLGAARQLRGGAPLAHRMTELCRITAELLGCDRSSIMVRDGNVFRATYNWGNPVELDADFQNYTVPVDAPLMDEMRRTGRAIVLNHTRTHAILEAIAEQANIDAMVLAPLQASDGSLVGFMTAEYNETSGVFDEAHAEVVLGLAGLALGPLFEQQLHQTRETEREQRQALEQVVRAEDSVRRSLGRELHDTILQSVLALALHLDLDAASRPGPESDAIGELVAECRSIGDRLRCIIEDLHPLSMEPTEIADSLGSLGRRKAIQGDWAVDIDIDIDVEPSDAARTACYRLAQHIFEKLLIEGAPSKVALGLRSGRADEVVMTITADGPPVDLSGDNRREGISSLSDGAALLGGSYRATTGVDGMVVELWLPGGLSAFGHTDDTAP